MHDWIYTEQNRFKLPLIQKSILINIIVISANNVILTAENAAEKYTEQYTIYIGDNYRKCHSRLFQMFPYIQNKSYFLEPPQRPAYVNFVGCPNGN